jgi:hypothetical protein
MSANRNDLISQMNTASSELLREKGYISFVDLLLRMGKLTQQDYEAWRNRKVPYLEKVITINLSKICMLLRALHTNSDNGGLRPSHTAYLSWGKGKKVPLRFSKSGDPNLERVWATHFLPSQKRAGDGKVVASDRDDMAACEQRREVTIRNFRKVQKDAGRGQEPVGEGK